MGDLMKKKLEKATFFKRFMAQLIDMFIIGLIIGIITMGFSTSRIEKLDEELIDLMDSYTSGEITSDKYIDDYIDIMYDINKVSFNNNLVYLVVCVGYFLIFQFLNKGATIGKKIMRIRVVSNDGVDASFVQMFIRTSIINEIIPISMLLILVMVSSGGLFFIFYSMISVIENIFVIICIFMILYRSDKLALHDMMSKSMVIDEV